MTFTESAVKMPREDELISIKREIERNGYHITVVTSGVCPRFIYTIGLFEKIGFDFIVPGCAKYYPEDLINIICDFVRLVESEERSFLFEKLGTFSLRPSDPSWIELMALGAIDYYGEVTPFMQIRPEESNLTIDTPDLSRVWNATGESGWHWLKEPWLLPVPSTSTATTNLAALRGARVTEAARWAEDEWELFAGSGPDTPEEDIRIMPLATLLDYDPSILEVVGLEIGKAAWRGASELVWHDWATAR